MTEPTWRVELADLRTDRTLADVEASAVEFDRLIGKPGSLSCTITIPDRATADLIRPCETQRTAVYVYRGDRDIWWSGILWRRSIERSQRGPHKVRLSAAGFESYAHRVVPWFIGTPNSVGDFDQLDLARDLIDEMQTIATNLGITVDSTLSGVYRRVNPSLGQVDPFAGALNSGTSFGAALDALADRVDGFEFTIDVYHDSTGTRRRHMRLGYPQLGRTDPQHNLTDPGNIVAWTWDEDGTRGGTEVRVRGGSIAWNGSMVPAFDYTGDDDPSDLPPPVSRFDAARLAAGWPVVTVVVDDSTLTTRYQIRPRIEAEIARLAGAVSTPSVTVRLSETDITPQHLGDEVRIDISDTWWTPPLSTTARMVGFKVRPPARGSDDSMEIYLEATDALSPTAG